MHSLRWCSPGRKRHWILTTGKLTSQKISYDISYFITIRVLICCAFPTIQSNGNLASRLLHSPMMTDVQKTQPRGLGTLHRRERERDSLLFGKRFDILKQSFATAGESASGEVNYIVGS